MIEFVKPIKKLDLIFFNEIKKEILSVIQKHKFLNGIYQLGVQTSSADKSNPEQYYESIGRITPGLIEADFTHIHPELKDGFIEKFINSIGDYKLVRTRIMYMNPKTCYSIHMDPTDRIHLPILTNISCFMIFPENSVVKHMPADGTVYYTKTTTNHTFINGSTLPRIHLVSSIDKVKL